MVYEWAQKQGVPIYETEKYYENLGKFYDKRIDKTKPQIFIVYGKDFLALRNCLWWSFLYQLIYFGLLLGVLFVFRKIGLSK